MTEAVDFTALFQRSFLPDLPGHSPSPAASRRCVATTREPRQGSVAHSEPDPQSGERTNTAQPYRWV